VYIILFLSLGKSKSGRTYVNGHKGGGGVLFTKYIYIKKNQGPSTFIMRTVHNEIYDGKKCIHYALALFAARVFFHAFSFLRGTATVDGWKKG